MRKLLFISLIILRSTLTLIAQWTGTTTLSNVGIGTNQPLAKLFLFYTSNNKRSRTRLQNPLKSFDDRLRVSKKN